MLTHAYGTLLNAPPPPPAGGATDDSGTTFASTCTDTDTDTVEIDIKKDGGYCCEYTGWD